MRKSSLFALAALSAVFALGYAGAQDIPAATRGDLEVGGTFSFAQPDASGFIVGSSPPRYSAKSTTYGGSIYANFNVTQTLGLTAQFDYPTYHTPNDFLEKSYLVGLRYYHPVGYTKFVPYVKVLAGMGSTAYDKPVNWIIFPGTPGSYTEIAFGGGVDYRWKRKWTVRAIDLQYEDWLGFPGGSIHPYIISVGVAYHVR